MAGDSDSQSNSKAPENSPTPEIEPPPVPKAENESKSPPSPPPTSDSEESKSPPPSPPSSPPSSSSTLPPSSPSTEQSTSVQDSPPGGEASPRPPVQQSVPAFPGNAPATPGLVPPITTTTTAFAPPTTNNHLTSPADMASGGSSNGEGQTTSSSTSATTSYYKPSSSSGLPQDGVIAGVAVGIVLLILVAILVCLLIKKKKTPPSVMRPYGWDALANPQGSATMASSTGHGYIASPSGPSKIPVESTVGLGLGFNKSTFTYEELAAATNGFNQANMLGQGGFGYVHKGVLPDGRTVAVKSLKFGSGQGEREFMAEVEMLSRVHHRHLVSLVGYYMANGQRMLVYDFLPNDTLEYHLHSKGYPIFGFPTRLRIALGSAKGLAYLHEDCHPRIIHRDVKASNILLDGNFEAMVADFGLAKLTNDTNTHVSTRVMGTFGYLAPEYAASGKLTEKSDVFSFGVMLLELITGRRPVDPNTQYMEDSLVDWSRPLMSKALEIGKFDELVDPKLEGSYNPQEMKRMIACAAASTRHSAKKRPKMSQIVRVLQGDVSLEDLDEGTKPGQSSNYSSSSEYNTREYSVDLKRFRQIAFATQEFASSERGGGSTSEDGVSSSSSSDVSGEMKR